MSTGERTFRVFRCPHCRYTGYKAVRTEDEDSACNLCSRIISPSLEMEYVSTVEEARLAIQRITVRSQQPQPKSRHGLGVRRRVLNIVSDLSDLNRGRGVSHREVLQECEEANIDLNQARRYLSQLEEEGLISDTEGMLARVEG